MVSSRAPKGLKAATSGSSGTPVTVYRSHLSWAHAHANVFRAWHWHGLEVGDRYAYLWGSRSIGPAASSPTARTGSSTASAARRSRSTANGRARSTTGCARLARFALGYPSALTQFAEEVRALGRDGRALGWKAAISTAEVLRPHQRETIAEVFGCPVVDSYGCAEAGVAGFECEALSMHVPIESVVVDEIPAEGGQREILLTDLHNYTQPLIRYRVGDLVEPRATVNGAGACACGRALPLLGRPFGRAGDTLELPDGRRMNANQPSYVFKHHGKAGTVREYQFVQFPKSIELRIVPGPAWTDEVRGQLGGEVREALGLEVEIRVVERFERRGRGKHRDFVKAEEIGEG